ncbi:MAG: hypothetical protein HY236_05790 [Acidobacteria bacterium]|nr:hypothetical protein [Acidobacteriota bacterium]
MDGFAFPVVWQNIAALEGDTFQTARGTAFTYRFHKTFIVVSSGNQSIPRTYFEKVFKRLEEGALEGSPSLQGQTYILAILTDERLRSLGIGGRA